ncbi:MAG: PEGA domain-containing protein [Planctomycetes bacterium]|nr:PEGA domain-containing protein [Planctomycetota bacterium]
MKRFLFNVTKPAAVAFCAAVPAACRTLALIDSNPRGAAVEINGVRGVTPFTAELPVTTFDHYNYKMELEGYESREGELAKTPNTGLILLSFAFPPALLQDVYRPATYTYVELRPLRNFPAGFSREEPWKSALPPLPIGMTQPVVERERAATRPAPPEQK